MGVIGAAAATTLVSRPHLVDVGLLNAVVVVVGDVFLTELRRVVRLLGVLFVLCVRVRVNEAAVDAVLSKRVAAWLPRYRSVFRLRSL